MLVALALGLVGSLHCAGMCGPLAMLISGPNQRRVLMNRLLYNAGRTITYSFAGLMMGLAGEVIHLGGFQNIASIVVGLGVLFFLVVPSTGAWLSPALSTVLYKIKIKLAAHLKAPRYFSALMAGMLNGILPCGMVYMALALALLQETLAGSVVFMALFGLGTIPMMLLAVYAGSMVRKYIPVSWKKIQTAFLVLLAALMIGRGAMQQVGFDFHFFGHSSITECK